jgi:hypothetical protein
MDRHDVRYKARRLTRLASAALLLIATFAAINPAAALTFAQTAHQGPALAVFNNKLYIAVTGTNSQSTLYINSSADGVTWPTTFQSLTPASSNANAGPGLAAFKNNLYVAWVIGNNEINIMHSSDGVNFSGQINLGATDGTFVSTGTPSLTATANYLILAWLSHRVNNGATEPVLYTAYSTDGVNWSFPQSEEFGSGNLAPYAPAALAFDLNGGVNGCLGWVRPTSVVSTTRHVEVGSLGSPTGVCGFSTANQSEEPYTTGIGLGMNGADIYVIWVGTHLASQVRIWRYTNFAFVGETVTSQTSFTNPSITGFNNHTFYAWSGTDNPSHVNVAQLN